MKHSSLSFTARNTSNRCPIALTMGDPCGIGPEITAGFLSACMRYGLHNIVVIGPIRVLYEAFDRLNIGRPLFAPFGSSDSQAVKYLDIEVSKTPSPGVICAEAGAVAVKSIESAHRLCVEGMCAAMVTGPIGKEAIRLAGSPFSGHTDMLRNLTGVKDTRMAMVYGKMRVVMTTLHLSLKKAMESLSVDAVFQTLLLAHFSIASKRDPCPPMAVGGVNPHAGENGLFGDEEIKIVKPAIELFRSVNSNVAGPFPVDVLFKKEHRRRYHAFVAHFHDHGLSAIKALGGIRCVNVTLGLPYVRTSVGHGTAYDIAGKGTADYKGLQAAFAEAERLVGNRCRVRQ